MWQSEEKVIFVKLQKFEENFFFILHFCTFLNGTSFYATEVLTYSSKKIKTFDMFRLTHNPVPRHIKVPRHYG